MGAVISAIGWGVVILWVLGAAGLGDFQVHFGPPPPDSEKRYVCVTADNFRRRYACDEAEFNRVIRN